MSATATAADPTPAKAAQTASAIANGTGSPSFPVLDGAALAKSVEDSKDPRDKTLVIRKVTDDIVIFSVPFVRAFCSMRTSFWRIAFADTSQARVGFIPIGGRSTAIRLPSGIFIYVSTALTPATRAVIDKMGGEVKWLVTPDGEHSMYIEEYTKAFPDAK
jgi:hypothetical protein